MGLDHAPDRSTSASGANNCAKIHEDFHEVSLAKRAAAKTQDVDGDRDSRNAVEGGETVFQVRKPEPVNTMDPMDVLFPHERSPDASHSHKRSAAALSDGDGYSVLLEHPCDKKLRREDHASAAAPAGTESQLLRRPHLPSVSVTATTAATTISVSPTRLLSPLDVADADQIRQHLSDVRREVFLRPMIAIVTRLMFHKYNHGLFNVRVDPVEWNIPHYFEVVKTPMDLTLVKTKCLNLEYASVEACIADIKLVFSNACLFNPPGHVVHECAQLLAKEFDVELVRYHSKKEIQDKRRDDHSCPSCLANVCGICNEKCINFEPPLVMCSGPCKQRIKRHAVYYKTHDRLHYWCAKCYTTLPKVVGLPLPTGRGGEEVKLSKHELVKAKFVDELTEPWVQCDSCDGWVHQVCALFNACENAGDDEDVPYTCPVCRLQSLEQEQSSWKQLEAHPSETSVDEFPVKIHRDLLATVGSHSPVVKRKPPLKDFTRVLGFGGEAQQMVLDYLRAEEVEAFELSVSDNSGACRTSSQLLSSPLSIFMQNWIRQFLIGAGESEVAGSIVIKVASCIKSQGVISPIVREHFQSVVQKYPETMEYISKSIFVFQKIEGVEVCIFSMYVQEYEADAAVVANRNRTYIAYIDSLVYMRPRHIRTKLFHELLISYLAFCKGKGFEYAHIWACPTTRGGDFIYWCHPSFQKNPGKDRLLQWYLAMVEKAKKAGVAFSCEDLFTTDFEKLEDNLERHLPPYFDGDYWAAEVERLHANPPKRGKLSKEKYEESLRGEKFRKKLVESVRLSRESLFVIALQPKCSSCNNLVINSPCWKIGDAQVFVCNVCKPTDAVDAEKVDPPHFVKSCEDVEEEEVSCPFVDYRADMLKNCEEQHYQFDSFRRAKYSTMMLIYHIASTQRAAPKH